LSSLKGFGRRTLATLVERFGYELKVKAAPLRGYTTFLEQCKKRGLAISTVLDAGVGMGTPWLYECFPSSKIVLFEPQRQFLSVMEALRQRYDVEYHVTALGARQGEAEINIPREFVTAASLKTHSKNLLLAIRREGLRRTYETEKVPISTLDTLNTYAPAYLLKIDVEGSELAVLHGAERTLKNTALLIVETSLVERYEDGCTFIDVANFLDAHGFALYEIVEMGVRTSSAPVAFLDAAFVPKKSHLRNL